MHVTDTQQWRKKCVLSCKCHVQYVLSCKGFHDIVLSFFLINKFLKSKTTHQPNSTYVKIFNDYFSIHRSINMYVYIYINGYKIFWKGIDQTASRDCLLLYTSIHFKLLKQIRTYLYII